MPPMDRHWLVRWATAFERIGARLWPAFAGVIIVEARKELMGALPKGKPAKGKTVLVPARGLLKDGRGSRDGAPAISRLHRWHR